MIIVHTLYLFSLFQTAQFDETEFVELKDKVMEQEAVIDDLQREMDGLRSISLQHKEQVQQVSYLSEPRREETGLRDFRPGPTQTGLYSQRRWPEAWDFGFR